MGTATFILGAGASYEAGAPLMRDFLDRAEDVQLEGACHEDSDHFGRVFSAIRTLRSLQSQIQIDANNLESVLSTFEMGVLTGRLGDLGRSDISALREAMARVIARTLQHTVAFPVERDRKAFVVHPPTAYRQFVQQLIGLPQLLRQTGVRDCMAVITLNYDLAIDYALSQERIAFDYGLGQELKEDAVPLLKLHGSLNWVRNPKDGAALVYSVADYLAKYRYPVWEDGDEIPATMTLDLPNRLWELRVDGAQQRAPLIVPPTWNKTQHTAIEPVWRHAAEALGRARYLFFIGYSFPETDLYIRYLLGVALAHQARLRRIFVVDPDESAAERLKNVLNPNVRARVIYARAPFSIAATVIREMIAEEDLPESLIHAATTWPRAASGRTLAAKALRTRR